MSTCHAFKANTSSCCTAASRLSLAAIVLLGAMAACCGGSKPAAESAPAAGGEAGSAKALVEKKCTTCHKMDKVTAMRGDEAKWTTEVEAMVGKGLKVSDKEKSEIIAFLAAEQGPEPAATPKAD
jgi:hypothetical protein